MSLYGWFCVGMLTLLVTFSSIHIADEGSTQASREASAFEPDLLFQYADYSRSVIRDMQSKNALTSARPAYVKVLGITSQNAGSPLEPEKSATVITTASIARLGMGNVLADAGNGKDLLYVWAAPGNVKDVAKIRRSLAQGGHAIFYVRDGANLVPGGRPGDLIPLPAAVQAVIPNGSTVIIQHPVE